MTTIRYPTSISLNETDYQRMKAIQDKEKISVIEIFRKGMESITVNRKVEKIEPQG